MYSFSASLSEQSLLRSAGRVSSVIIALLCERTLGSLCFPPASIESGAASPLIVSIEMGFLLITVGSKFLLCPPLQYRGGRYKKNSRVWKRCWTPPARLIRNGVVPPNSIPCFECALPKTVVSALWDDSVCASRCAHSLWIIQTLVKISWGW